MRARALCPLAAATALLTDVLFQTSAQKLQYPGDWYLPGHTSPTSSDGLKQAVRSALTTLDAFGPDMPETGY